MSTETVGNLGALVAGLAASVLTAFAVKWLWPEMAIPVFILAILCLTVSWSSMVHRDRLKKRGISTPWTSGVKGSALSPEFVADEQGKISWYYISDLVLSITTGIVAAAIVAGLVGLLWPNLRWIIFIVVAAIWATIGISVTIQDWKARRWTTSDQPM